jgi:hypothetical protein
MPVLDFVLWRLTTLSQVGQYVDNMSLVVRCGFQKWFCVQFCVCVLCVVVRYF